MKLRKILINATTVALASVGLSTAISAPALATSCLSNPAVTQGDLSNNANYTLCHYDNYVFTGLTASGVEFHIGTANAAWFNNAVFHSAVFDNVVAHSMNFTHADMDSSDFRLTDMQGSDLTDATFTNTNLHFAHLENSTKNRVNLTGANLDNVFLGGADLTDATVTQAQLALAVLNDATVCPDGYQLGVHTGDCFSALKPLTPVVSTPVITSGGFTFAVDNYNELYTYTITLVSGQGNPTIASPTGSKLPMSVSDVPTGSTTVVKVTSTIGTVSASLLVSNKPALPDTGANVAPAGGIAAALLLVGAVVSSVAWRRRRS
jgi:uncharacterized protein YjbI with pentapeptide repeats